MSSYDALFSPGKIGALELPNRTVLAPMGTNYADSGHHVTDRLIAYHVARARGGVGLSITEHAAVHPLGLTGANMLAICDDGMIEGLSRLADGMHEAGGRIAVQLQHGGRQADPEVIGQCCLSPSAVTAGRDQRMPEKMTVEQIREAVEAFGEGARRAKEAGMDGVEVHMAHGYLGCSFLSPLLNRRDDQYGGDTERRTRFAAEVREAIAERCGDDFPIWCRISADELIEGGTDLDEARRFAPLLQEHGYQALHVSVCIGETARYASGPYYLPQGHLIEYAAGVKEVVDVPIIGVGRIVEPAMADEFIREGKCDFVALGRGLLADAEWPVKAQEGREDDIIRCFGCGRGCGDRSFSPEAHAQCAANPWTGREVDWPDWPDGPPAPSARRVLVIGAGPGGMQAAITAARRGNEVTLWEREPEVGGAFRLAALPPDKGELKSLITWQEAELRRAGVELLTNYPATADAVLNFDPEVVIIATGAQALGPESLPVGAGGSFVMAEEVLRGEADLRSPVYVIGGDVTGTETAHLIADQGHEVTILERGEQLAANVVATPRTFLLERLEKLGVRIITGSYVQGLDAEGIKAIEGEIERRYDDAGTVVLAIGRRPRGELIEELEGASLDIIVIGDAKELRHAQAAIYEGAAAGREI